MAEGSEGGVHAIAVKCQLDVLMRSEGMTLAYGPCGVGGCGGGSIDDR